MAGFTLLHLNYGVALGCCAGHSIAASPAELAVGASIKVETTLLASMWLHGPEDAGFQYYRGTHIPNSILCGPARALTSAPSSKLGRNPLPDPVSLQKWFELWDLNDNYRVVACDGGRGFMSARDWWILTWVGWSLAVVYIGGWSQWCATPSNPVATVA